MLGTTLKGCEVHAPEVVVINDLEEQGQVLSILQFLFRGTSVKKN